MRSLIMTDHDHAEVRLTVGEQLEVAVAENAGTGFAWVPTTDPGDVVEIVEDRFEAPGTLATGAAGVRRFVVAGRRAGDAVLTLALRRAWETGKPARRVAVSIAVRASPAE
jgi:predicted secreted protein